MIGLILFDTALGVVGLAWSERGIVAVRLPAATPEATRASFLARHPDACEAAPPPAILDVIDRIAALTRGERVDLSGAPLDRDGLPDFQARVTDVTLAISVGDTLTYGEVARRIGEPGAAQAVGRALGANPWPIVVPCHRVLAASGKTGGFSAPGGVDTKLKLLSIERARTSAAPTLFDGDPAFGLAARPRGN
ncbi:MAG: methylated-DNA--[protein]-cysteine S-methyltransferase [Phreatobacter sp.]|nr:methylated-DNA--[protein]-cysteine S-methyltransferase [Phreatobacter sp.]